MRSSRFPMKRESSTCHRASSQGMMVIEENRLLVYNCAIDFYHFWLCSEAEGYYRVQHLSTSPSPTPSPLPKSQPKRKRT